MFIFLGASSRWVLDGDDTYFPSFGLSTTIVNTVGKHNLVLNIQLHLGTTSTWFYLIAGTFLDVVSGGFQLEWRDERAALLLLGLCQGHDCWSPQSCSLWFGQEQLGHRTRQQDGSSSLRAVPAEPDHLGTKLQSFRTPKRSPGNMDYKGKKEGSGSRPLDCYISSKCSQNIAECCPAWVPTGSDIIWQSPSHILNAQEHSELQNL